MVRRLTFALLAGLLCVGCGGELESSDSGTAYVRTVNAVPNLSAANVTVGATIASSDLAYAAASEYATVVSGSSQALTLTDGSGTLLVDTSASLESGYYYTVYAVGSTSSTELIAIHENHAAPDTGYARVSLVNAAPSASTVDVYVTEEGADISELSPNVSGLVYKAGQSLTIATGTYRVRFTTSGTKDVVYDYSTGELGAGTLPRVVLLDASAGGTPLQVLVLSDVG